MRRSRPETAATTVDFVAHPSPLPARARYELSSLNRQCPRSASMLAALLQYNCTACIDPLPVCERMQLNRKFPLGKPRRFTRRRPPYSRRYILENFPRVMLQNHRIYLILELFSWTGALYHTVVLD